MPRAIGSKDYSSLSRGLITEASEIAFPDGATSDELNFLLDSSGIKRIKRKGLETIRSESSVEFQDFKALFDAQLSAVEYWNAPNLLIFVIRNSNTAAINNTVTRIEFRNPETLALVGTQVFVINPSTEVGETSIATLDNFAAIVPAEGSQYICEYNEGAGTITVNTFQGYVRDFELIPDGQAIAVRPASLTDNHEYNLLNAGWYAPRRSDTNEAFTNPITDFFAQSGNTQYPSNADIVTVGLFDNSNGNEVFDRDKVLEANLGNTVAPRGHYIYQFTDTDRDSRRTTPTDDGAPATTVTNTDGTITL